MAVFSARKTSLATEDDLDLGLPHCPMTEALLSYFTYCTKSSNDAFDKRGLLFDKAAVKSIYAASCPYQQWPTRSKLSLTPKGTQNFSMSQALQAGQHNEARHFGKIDFRDDE